MLRLLRCSTVMINFWHDASTVRGCEQRGNPLTERLPKPTDGGRESAPPGWYPNPDGSPSERYWDGQRWSNQQRSGAALRRSLANPGHTTDPQPVERGSNRWMVGIAMLVVSAGLALSSFVDWAHLTYSVPDRSYGQLKVDAALSGFGSISVDVSGIKDVTQRRFVERQEAAALEAEDPAKPGVAPFIGALLIASAAWAFLSSSHRLVAAGVVTAASTVGLIIGLWELMDVRGLFNNPAGWSSAHYSPGLGLVAATVAAVLLGGLGVAALFLERNEGTSPRQRSR